MVFLTGYLVPLVAMVGMGLVVVVGLLYSLTDKYCRQVGEDKGLDGRNQELQEKHKDREGKRYRYKAPPGHLTQRAENEDHGYDAQDHDVPRQHVGKKTDHQGHRLDEQRDHLDRYQQELNAQGYARRIEQVAPEMFVTVEYHHQKKRS